MEHLTELLKAAGAGLSILAVVAGLIGATAVGRHIIQTLPKQLADGLDALNKKIDGFQDGFTKKYEALRSENQELAHRVVKLEAKFEQRGALITELKENVTEIRKEQGEIRREQSVHGAALARIEGALGVATQNVHLVNPSRLP